MIIAVDFDGTIVKHKYPSIGKEIPFAIKTLKAFQERGHKLILWSYRSGEDLEKAVEFCRKQGLMFHAVNNNFDGEEFDGSYSRKIYADLFIDDRNLLGLPDWEKLYNIMANNENVEKGIKKLTFES
ncbi:MAG TPA: hydrolase [Draconibacterium sp.]|nr:hydrolase [Draconibacterium sp.]